MKFSVVNLIRYFTIMSVSFHDLNALFGFMIFLTIASQLVSGTMLSFSLVPESMLIPVVRDEEDVEDLYADDFFWLHERGVDLIFIFSYLHLFRKLYINVFEYEHEIAWKSGVFSFMVFQVVVFAGLVLCCTHLSEITLTIAANIMHSIFMFKGKPYWWIFTDKQLNTDTIIRLAYMHYVSAFYLFYISLIHGIDLHYDWKNEATADGIHTEIVWFDEALTNELSTAIDLAIVIFVVTFVLYEEPEALTYEIFMWGDIGLTTDVRYYGVAPHWYFRPFMAWLIVCPHHYTGIFGLLFFFFLLFHQPVLHGTTEQNNYLKRSLTFSKFKLKRNSAYTSKYVSLEANVWHAMTFYWFVMSCLYTTTFLPYGRFYNRLQGNWGMFGAYSYILLYLTFPIFRRPSVLEYSSTFMFNKISSLNNSRRK